MLKRIISIALIVMLLPIYAVSAAEMPDIETDNEMYETASMLVALGIMDTMEDGTFRGDEYMTRGELAKLAAVIYGLGDYKATESVFEDIDEAHRYYDSIYACLKYELMRGVTSDRFEPDGYITKDQLNMVIIRLLGYEYFANQQGAYPEGAKRVAAMLGLYGYLRQKGEYMTRNEIAVYVYEALNTYVAMYEGSANGKIDFMENSGTTLAEAYMNLKRIEGIVNANNVSALPGSSMTGKGEAVIADTKVVTGDTDLDRLLGRYVIAYVKYEGDKPGVVKGYIEAKDKTEVVEIHSKDIVPSKTNAFQITASFNNKEMTYNLTDNVVVVRNGELLSPYSSDDFKITLGKIRVIDTKSTGRYNLVEIDAPQSLMFDKYNSQNNTLYFKYDKPKIELNNDTEIRVVVDGTEADITQVTEWMSVFVYLDSKKTLCRIEASSKTVLGKYTSTNNQSIFIDGIAYERAVDFDVYIAAEGGISLGGTYPFVINPYGEIVGISSPDTTVIKYGFVVAIEENDEPFTPDVDIQICTENSTVGVYKLRKKVKVVKGDTEQMVAASALAGGMYDGASFVEQIVKYTLNTKGELTALYIANDNTGSTNYDDNKFRLDYNKVGGSSVRCYNKRIGGIYSINTNKIKVFNIPMSYQTDRYVWNAKPEDAYVTDGSEISGDGYYTHIKMYDVDKFYNIGVLVKYFNVKGTSISSVKKVEAGVINDIYNVILENGDTGYEIEYYVNGSLKKTYCEEDKKTFVPNDIKWYDEAMDVSDLRRGDFVQVYVNSRKNMVDYVHLIGRPEKVSEDREKVSYTTKKDGDYQTTTPTEVFIENLHTVPGTVKAADAENLLVETKAGNGETCERGMMYTTATKFYLYETVADKVSVVTAADVCVDDKVYVRLYDWSCRTVYLIR